MLRGPRALLLAEGPGWQHQSWHENLHAAALYLAAVTEVPQALYEQALHDLGRRLDLERAA
ncbi:hypothetical protein ACFP81_06010 [Deinococcus lacus]|uniref:Uncharacterized protein n=1 Tax=Deinococcus lacus TaxID=392561 RepID=A0ABW1YBL7_9DEIO